MSDPNESPASIAANEALADVDMTVALQNLPPLPYCLCGNEHVEAPGTTLGPLCKPFLTGPLLMAYEAYRLVAEAWGTCCGGVSSDLSFGRTLEARILNFGSEAHLYLHPKSYGESSYYVPNGVCLKCQHEHTGVDDTCIAPVLTLSGGTATCSCNVFTVLVGTEPSMWVECGVRFYATYAEPYWIFDNDKIDTHSEPFGEHVPYTIGSPEVFLSRLAEQLDNAAREAYYSDYAICSECHGHYYSPNRPCCGDDETDEDEDTPVTFNPEETHALEDGHIAVARGDLADLFRKVQLAKISDEQRERDGYAQSALDTIAAWLRLQPESDEPELELPY